jgi:DNA helicase-2/ATP-dependent DNA helicase PcrA
MEEALLSANVSYKVIGSFYFYKRREIKDIIAYLKLIYNPKDDINLLRVINTPKRGIGLKTVSNIQQKAEEQNLPLFEAITDGKELEFKKIILELIDKKDSCTLTELVDLVMDLSGLRQSLKNEKTIDSEVRLENMEEFKSITTSFETREGLTSLDDFLSEISLVADIEEHKDNKEVVTLMTVHSAKGLEFKYIFVLGLEEGVFPHINALTEGNLEEERRLCYVAITRAKDRVYLTNTQHRMLFGQTNANLPSRFINEINPDYLALKTSSKEFFSRGNYKHRIDETKTYNVGDKVKHVTFGLGVIVAIKGSILTIAFKNPIGIKTLMKGHKSIEVIKEKI